METFVSIFGNPFVAGITGALIGWVACFINDFRKRSDMKQSMKRLDREREDNKRALTAQADALVAQRQVQAETIDKLKAQVQNLQTTVKALTNNPSKQEILLLQRYQKVVEGMTVNVPGFAQSWQKGLDEVEATEESSILEGLKPFAKKLMPTKKTKRIMGKTSVDDGGSNAQIDDSEIVG